MSRSYKKNPIIKDNGKGKKKQKRLAWKHIRALLRADVDIPSGNGYKKYYCSWDIADFISRWTLDEALAYFRKKSDPNSVDYSEAFVKRYPTEEDFIQFWRRCYKSK